MTRWDTPEGTVSIRLGIVRQAELFDEEAVLERAMEICDKHGRGRLSAQLEELQLSLG